MSLSDSLPSSFSALRNRNYRYYFAGQVTSMSGTWIQGTVQSWLVYRLSHSAAWLGIISFCLQAPAFLLSPLAGVIADHSDRRKTLLWASVVSMLQALALAVLVFTGWIQLWQIAVLAAILGLTNAFDLTNRHAFVIDMVGRDDLQSAIACNSLIINTSRIIGPSIAGVLISMVSEGWCFLLNGVSYLAVIWGLMLIQIPARAPRHHPRTEKAGLFDEMLEAWHYMRRTPEISRLIRASTFMSFFGFAYTVLLPVFAHDYLHGDASMLAWLMGATGVGAIAGALSAAARADFARKIESRLPLAFVLIGFFLALLGASHQPWLSVLAVLGIGFFFMGTYPSINTAIQQRVDDSFRGRILSLYTMSFLGAAPAGTLLAGWAADRVGAGRVEYLNGAVFVVSGLFLLVKALRSARAPRPSGPALTPR